MTEDYGWSIDKQFSNWQVYLLIFKKCLFEKRL
jgi:hypothetical protein